MLMIEQYNLYLELAKFRSLKHSDLLNSHKKYKLGRKNGNTEKSVKNVKILYELVEELGV